MKYIGGLFCYEIEIFFVFYELVSIVTRLSVIDDVTNFYECSPNIFSNLGEICLSDLVLEWLFLIFFFQCFIKFFSNSLFCIG
jgi:hypothetical protein